MNRMTTTVFGLALIVLLCGAASAATIWVPEGGNQTIQQAVNNATAGDVIIVRDGTYNENVNVNVAHLTIQSENGSANCIVNASNSNDHVFDVQRDYVNVSGFTVQNATGTLPWQAGIHLDGADHCNISHNNVTNNYLGIFLHNSSNSNELTGNICSGNDHGILLYNSSNNNTLTGNICTGNDECGIYLYSSNNNTLTENDCSGTGYGIYLHDSNSNELTENDCSGTGYGIYLHDSNSNELTENDCSGNVCGIYLCISNNNNTLTGNDCSGNYIGIYLFYSNNNNTLTGNDCSAGNGYGIAYQLCDNNPLTGNNCSGNNYGIWLHNSSDNMLTENDCSYSGIWGFYSYADSHNNVVEDLTVASYPTTISFTYDNGIAVTGVETPPADPAGKTNISRYVNATNVTAESWLFLNVSYNDTDLAGLDESSLLMWQHNGTVWSAVAGSGVNEAENYVYANITAFSVFAPMGDSSPTPPTEVPTLTPPGVALMIGLLAVVGSVMLRRRE